MCVRVCVRVSLFVRSLTDVSAVYSSCRFDPDTACRSALSSQQEHKQTLFCCVTVSVCVCDEEDSKPSHSLILPSELHLFRYTFSRHTFP